MVQFRAIDRRRAPTDIVRSFETRAASLKRRVYESIAHRVIDYSPVDTGTYIMAHTVQAGRSAGSVASESSEGKLRGRPKAMFEQQARARLLGSVATIPPDATDVYFVNSAMHAPRVEYLGWDAPLFGDPNIAGPGPYRVYARARAEVGQMIQTAAAELGFETR